MSIPDLCIYFVIGILSVAYPILLQVISRLDEKYSSVIIVDLFEKEIQWRLFRLLLIVTLASIVGYIAINLFIKLNTIPYIVLIVGYALILSTTLLILFFLLFIKKILTYYTPSKAINYFIVKKENENFEYFKALGDILYFSVEQQKEIFAQLIFAYFSKTFSDVRTKTKGQPVVYPEPYYELITNIAAKLAPLNNRRFGFLEHRTVGGLWLLGDMDDTEVSERTFSCVWYCLATAINFERDDMIMQYWSVAHQNFSLNLKRVQQEYENQDGKISITNKRAIEKRDNERGRFLEFNHALGGLLLYKSRLGCIKRIFSYTTSIPPDYVLLPLSMTQVLNTFFRFWDAYHDNFPFISFKYWFPETEGVKSDELVKSWSSNYTALLFLRQYAIVPYFTYVLPLAYPEIPKAKIVRKMWIDNLDCFKGLVESVYQNENWLKGVGLGFLNDKWCDENNKVKPIQFIDNVKTMVVEAYNRTEVEQTISETDLKRFFSNTTQILNQTLKTYLDLFNKPIDGQYNGYVLPGIRGVMEKNPFAEDKEADYLNHYSIYAQSLADTIKEWVSNNFFIAKNRVYYVNPGDIFIAINKLNPNPPEYVIINLGMDLTTLVDSKNIEELTKSHYKGIELHYLPFFGRTTDRRLVVIRKDNLPHLFLDNFPKTDIDKYHLQKLKDLSIYASITDLYRDASIKDDVLNDPEFTEEQKNDIEKKVLIYIGMRLVIRWAESTSTTSISPYYSYLPEWVKQTDVNDIVPLAIKIEEKTMGEK